MAEADRLIARALELNPNSAEAYRAQAAQHMKRRRHEEWRASLLKAVALDPLAMMTRVNVAICAMAQHRYDEAEQILNEVKQMNPGWWLPERHLARLAQIKGNQLQATELQAAWQQLRGNTAAAEFTRAAAAAGGSEGFMRAAIAEPNKAGVGRAQLAYYHLALGDMDAAFRILHESDSAHDENVWMIVADPRFEPLYADPQYAELVKRTGFME